MSLQLDFFDSPLPEVVERITFNQLMRLVELLHFNKRKDGSRTSSLRKAMVNYFDGRFIDLLGRHDTISLLKWLRVEKGYGAWMLIKARGIMRLAFNLAEMWKEDRFVAGFDFTGLQIPRKNPTFKVVMPNPPRPTVFLSPFEFRAWIKASRIVGDQAFECAFKMGLWLRLSPIDLENLNDEEIDESDFEVRLYRRHTKTDKNPQGCLQVIELTEKSWALINRCRQFRKPGDTRIFDITTNKKRRFAKIRKVVQKLGGKDATLSAFRRSASDYLLEKGYTREAVADALGHTTEKIVEMHYASKKRSPKRREMTQELVSNFNG